MTINLQPILYIAIGPSGSGKSTIYNALSKKNPNMNYFSWDKYRLEWYDPEDYSNAWELSCKDKEFKLKLDEQFHKLLNERKDLFIDNTNLTKKRRRPYIENAQRLGYTVVGITFNVSLDTLIARQSTREDKYVPDKAVIQQFENYQYPSIMEGFDEIIDSENLRII